MSGLAINKRLQKRVCLEYIIRYHSKPIEPTTANELGSHKK